MRILITGGGGFVGTALADHLQSHNDVTAAGHAQLDITSDSQVMNAMVALRPDVVINCAVIGVDTCERQPALARSINVDGPRLLARAAHVGGAAIVHFSTNYVFRGDRHDGRFYDSTDEALPINAYGATKLEGERAVGDECERSAIVRTSWVFGPGGSGFLSTLPERLRARARVTAITDRFASVTYLPHLVARVTEIITARESGIFHVNNEGVCSYSEFADAASELLGLSDHERIAAIDYRTAAEAPTIATRPRWTPMSCSRSARVGLKPLPGWREALGDYIHASAAGSAAD